MLLDVERYPTATSLAMLAIEEIGKAGIIREMLLCADAAELRKLWRRYRKHTEKNQFVLVLDRIRHGQAAKLTDFSDLFTQQTEADRQTYDIVKQLGFYTDCCGNAHWASPADVIDAGLAIPLVQFAVALTRDKTSVTMQEMELWALHMRTGMTQDNLLRWCAAMVQAGLKPAGYMADMARFL